MHDSPSKAQHSPTTGETMPDNGVLFVYVPPTPFMGGLGASSTTGQTLEAIEEFGGPEQQWLKVLRVPEALDTFYVTDGGGPITVRRSAERVEGPVAPVAAPDVEVVDARDNSCLGSFAARVRLDLLPEHRAYVVFDGASHVRAAGLANQRAFTIEVPEGESCHRLLALDAAGRHTETEFCVSTGGGCRCVGGASEGAPTIALLLVFALLLRERRTA